MTAGQPAPLHIALVAGEESGDRLGAALMRALKARQPDGVVFSGVGGAQIAAEGMTSLFPVGELAIMGFTAIPGRIRTILGRIRQTADAVIAARPAALVIIDSPEFTHRVARRVRKHAPSIPIIDYVSPSVWAWRPGRAQAMRRYVDHVLALLPFEPGVHARLGGPPCTYVGHPMSERVAALRPTEQDTRRRNEAPPVLLVMPGSRTSELKRLLPIFARTVELVARDAGALDVVVAAVPWLADMVRAAVAGWPFAVRVAVERADRDAAFRVARAALVKSGTGTLEVALAGVPMVTAYTASWIEAATLRPFIKTPSVILANLVLGENIVPEFIQEAAQPEPMARALLPLLRETPQRRAQLAAFKRLDAIMEIETARPSDRAAEIVLKLAAAGRSLAA